MNVTRTSLLCFALGLSVTVPALAADPPAPEAPTSLAVGDGGSLTVGGLAQVWTVFEHRDVATGDDRLLYFRVRRAELKLSGEVVPDLVTFGIMIDPAKVLEFQDEELEGTDAAGGTVTVEAAQPTSKVSVLQDVYVGFLSDYVDFSIGQFKLPLSLEGYGSSSKLLFPERALVSSQYGDKRDLGFKLEKGFGKLGKSDYRFRYWAGLYSGDGLNVAEQGQDNTQKDVALRLEVMPLPELMVAAAGLMSVGERDEAATTKDRAEVDARLVLGDTLVQAEYLRGWDGAEGTGRLQGHGFYAAAAHTFGKRWQPMVRVGYLDQDADGDATGKADEVWSYEAGVAYLIAKHAAKVSLAGARFQYDDEKPRTQVIAAFQAGF